MNPPNSRPPIASNLPTEHCWTCDEPLTSNHNCILSLKAHLTRLKAQYNDLKERAINAGLEVRPVDR